MSYFYLYIIQFETGQFYIGSRKSKVPASEDIKYWGSPGKINESLWKLEKEKHILFESTDISYKELTNKEKFFIGEAWKKFGKDKCEINKNIGGNIDPKVISKIEVQKKDMLVVKMHWPTLHQNKELPINLRQQKQNQ